MNRIQSAIRFGGPYENCLNKDKNFDEAKKCCMLSCDESGLIENNPAGYLECTQACGDMDIIWKSFEKQKNLSSANYNMKHDNRLIKIIISLSLVVFIVLIFVYLK